MKGIIWRRGSTDRQEIESQDKELTELAISEGFKRKDLIHIGEAGASAIKQNDLYLQEVDKLISTLENDKSVKTVFVWEISRLARVELAFYKMKDYFLKNHIQVICKTPSLKLYDPDGKINQGSEVTLSLLVTLARQEMELKNERFRRSKKKAKEEGRFIGGKVKFGYILKSDKHFDIDPIKSGVIVEIFNRYINGASQYELVEDMVSRGFLTKNYNRLTTSKQVGYWLRDTAYIGQNNYPRIIDDETFYKAQERLKMRHKEHHSKHILFAKGLVKDKKTNATLVAQVPTVTYGCYYVDKFRSVNLNVMEYVAEYATNILLAKKNADEMERNMDLYNKKIVQNERLVKLHNEAIERIEKVIDRSIEMNINQPRYFPKEKLDAKIKQCEMDIQKERTAIEDLNIENTNMRSYLDGNAIFINSIKGLSLEKKSEIIHQTIKTIWVDGLDNKKREVYIEVDNKIGYPLSLKFIYRRIANQLKLWQVKEWDDDMPLELTCGLKSHSRFERKRYNKKVS